MPRDATSTRERLIRAGERRFAREGVAGARLRDVVLDAGQANDSAVGYHFGSRRGLLAAISARHIAAMEEVRAPVTASMTVPELVDAIVRPTCGLLGSPDGRDFLRIMEQLAGWSGLDTATPAPALAGTALELQLDALKAALERTHGRATARARTASLAVFLTASLADRARTVERGGRMAVAHQRYVDDLVAMLTGAMTAR